MSRRTFRIGEGEPLFDLVSYGRGGPRETGGRFTPAQVEQIRRTVNRAPEVVVKVLTRDSNNLKSAAKHINYIGQYGAIELETDDGEKIQGLVGKDVLEDWDLDIDDIRRQADLAATRGRKPPKIIHKLVLSMPAGTDPEKMRAAVRNFAREQFWGQHRYIHGLHTDQAHRHEHIALKAVSEQGTRLNIRKATLRYWRAEFARHLRAVGIEANATERAVRGESRKARRDGVYRSSLRGDSNYIRAQAEAIASELFKGDIRVEAGKRKLTETRKVVDDNWHSIATRLAKDGYRDLANDTRKFVERMPVVQTERERIAAELLQRAREVQVKDRPVSR